MANKKTKLEPVANPSGWKGDPKWKLLADEVVKHTRTYTLSNDEVKQKFIEFVEYYSNNPVASVERRSKRASSKSGATAQSDVVNKKAPMTELAFCVWCGKNGSWIGTTIRDLKAKDEPTVSDAERLDLFEKIKSFLNNQVMEGALLGDYVPMVAMPLIGIKNKFDVTTDDKPMGAPMINIVEDKGDAE